MKRRVLVVVSDLADLPEIEDQRRVTADAYLAGDVEVEAGTTVVNLCRSYRYRTKGYYVSLLADARGHQALPSVETVEALGDAFGLVRVLQEAGIDALDRSEIRSRRRSLPHTISPIDDEGIGKVGAPIVISPAAGQSAAAAESCEVLVYFGQCTDARFRAAAQAVYREWPTPVLRMTFVLDDSDWKAAHAAAVSLPQLTPEQRLPLAEALRDERALSRRGSPTPRGAKRASIAVLYDAEDPFAPSSPETIDRLERVAARMNVHVQRIGLQDMNRLAEYDALFIRALTGVREPAFPFALRAEMLEMPVIDDSQSIIRCSNKVFLDELLSREGVATPRTLVVTSRTPWEQLAELQLPLVVKLPDGSFSAAVHKIESEKAYREVAGEMFRRSPLIIAQEFLPTEFDWRVVILDGRVLFTARYFMARGHWQIRSERAGVERFGKVEAVPRDRAPREVVELAIRAASLIGNGLYGVDLKETRNGPVVIEINDNPNLDIGYDDTADGAVIYEDIVSYFLRQIETTPETTPEAASPPPPRQAKPRRSEAASRHYQPFSRVGMELEYAVVDRDLNCVSKVEELLRVVAGRPTSDVVLDGFGISNEIADHVLELKMPEPQRSLREAESSMAEGVEMLSATLRAEFGARLLPTGMHPWLDPRRGQLWTRSNSRVYQTYERIFDVHTHGWMNVHASHINLPLGREVEAVAMYNAAALLIPYLPALAASSPMHDGELQPQVDNRLAWIIQHQAAVPESCGEIVPEFIESFPDYRRKVITPMYTALDRFPDAGALRHEFFNARGAVFKFSRRSMEVRVLDMQECVKMDVAIAVFVRSVLRYLARRLLAGRLPLPEHALLVKDFQAVVQHGSAARVCAPFLHDQVERDDDGTTSARETLRVLSGWARRAVRKGEGEYLDLIDQLIEAGSLSERIRDVLMPYTDDEEAFTEAARRIYIELADCLESNQPWQRRGLGTAADGGEFAAKPIAAAPES